MKVNTPVIQATFPAAIFGMFAPCDHLLALILFVANSPMISHYYAYSNILQVDVVKSSEVQKTSRRTLTL